MMNKAKRARWSNPLEGVGTDERGLRFWVLQLLGRERGVGACAARAGGRRLPSKYIKMSRSDSYMKSPKALYKKLNLLGEICFDLKTFFQDERTCVMNLSEFSSPSDEVFGSSQIWHQLSIGINNHD